MSDLQTYKWANWVDVKDSDELVIYDTSKPTVIREADDWMYHITFRIKNIDDETQEEISDVCWTVTPKEVAVPKGSIIWRQTQPEDGKSMTFSFLFNEQVVATVEAVAIPDTAQYEYTVNPWMAEEWLIERWVIQKSGWLEFVFTRVEANLKSYDELVALNDHEAVLEELNGYPTSYYLSLKEAWHIQVREATEGEEGSVWTLVDGNGNETVIDFYTYAYVISSPDEEQIPSKTWMEQERPN